MLISITSFAQANFDEFVGTWVYQNSDTIFKITLQRGEMELFNNSKSNTGIFGGYSLSVNGEVIDNYIKSMPRKVTYNDYLPDFNIYIRGISSSPQYLGFIFYDQRIKHINGEGIGGGDMRLLTSTTLRWTLDEEYGLWHAVEGSEDADKYTLQGFSVPIDVIMNKEVEDIELDSKGLKPFK